MITPRVSLHVRTGIARPVERAIANVVARAAVSPAQAGWVSVFPHITETQNVLDEGRRIAAALSAQTQTAIVAFIVRTGDLAVLVYEAGDPAGIFSSNDQALPPTADELVAGNPIDAVLRHATPGTPREAIAGALGEDERSADERLNMLARAMAIDPSWARSGYDDVAARAEHGVKLVGEIPRDGDAATGTASHSGAAPTASPSPAEISERSIAIYSTVVALVGKAGELYEEMERQMGEDPTPQMMELFELGRRQYFQQLEEMLADASIPGAPTLSELSRAAARSDAALARLIADRVPIVLDTLARHVARTGNGELLKAILARGVRPDITDDEGRTLLMIACDNGSTECVKPLLDAGASLAARDATGHTPLLHAAAASPPAIVEQLLLAGADVHATAPGGATVLDVAKFNHHRTAVMPILRNAGAR